MEYIEAQRCQQKVRTKLENLHHNWGIERTLVPANELALVDEAYQHWIAKYKFIADRLKGICGLYEWQVRAGNEEQEHTDDEQDANHTNSLHWSDLAEVIVAPRESPHEEPSWVIDNSTRASNDQRNDDQPWHSDSGQTNLHPQPSLNTAAREQLQTLQMVWQFFENILTTVGEQNSMCKEVSANNRQNVTLSLVEGSQLVEGTPAIGENTPPWRGTPPRPMEDMDNHRP